MKSELQIRELHKNIPYVPGVYMLTNPTNGKRYIGSSVDLHNRYFTFLSSSYSGWYSGAEGKDSLREAILATPPHLWIYSILEFCEIDDLEERENYYIDLFNTIKDGYNKVYSHRNPISKNSRRYRVDGATLKKMYNCYSSFKDTIPYYYYKQGIEFTDDDIRKEFDMEKVYYKKQSAIDKNNGEPVRINCNILTLNKLPYEEITLDEIIWIPRDLGLMLKKEKPNKNIVDDVDFLYAKLTSIKKMVKKYKNNLDKEVYNILINLDIKDMVKLIYK